VYYSHAVGPTANFFTCEVPLVALADSIGNHLRQVEVDDSLTSLRIYSRTARNGGSIRRGFKQWPLTAYHQNVSSMELPVLRLPM